LGAASGLVVLLFLVVALFAPGREAISLGFNPNGGWLAPSAATQLFLLPAVYLLLFVASLLLGLFFYRQPGQLLLTRLLWISSLASGVLFLLAIIIILAQPLST
jgi:hypothetical protein